MLRCGLVAEARVRVLRASALQLGALSPSTTGQRRALNTQLNNSLCGFTDAQQRLFEQSERFSKEQIMPRAAAIDRENDWRAVWPTMWQELGDMGLLGVTIPEEYGGLGLNYVDQCAVLDSINYASASVGISVGAHANLCANQIRRNGTEEQKQQFLPALCAGIKIGALAMSEAHSGSDVLAMKTTAKQVDGGFVLNGSKFWITNGPDADVIVVYAKTEPENAKRTNVTAFLVERGMQGFSTPAKLDKVGHRGSNTGELVFEDCFIPEENVLGGVNRGAYVLMSGLDIERVVLAAGSIGLMRAAIDEALRYTRQREQFGQKIGEFQLVQAKLADMYAAFLQCRVTMYTLARTYDQCEARQDGSEKLLRKDTAASILVSGEAVERVTLDALQLLGGAGYLNDYPLGRFVRDAKLFTIGGGTSEVRRILAGRELFMCEPDH
eukprot:m.386679 g.386679  ORF g.386679 m.386679 type:complete len:439 (+) comp20056_c1_seq7:454-1770(+)